MTRDFDRLITKAAPDIPNSGPSRRVARALLHERMRERARQQHRRQRWGLSLAAGLAFLLVMGGQVAQLGSDGFDFELSTLELATGEKVPLVVNKVRGGVGPALPGMDRNDIYELRQQIILREGEIEELIGYSFDGGTPYWLVTSLMDVNGRTVRESRAPENLSVESRAPSRESMMFLADHLDDFLALIDSGQLASEPYATVTANGVEFNVLMWSQEFPDWGRFTYYRGLPTSP